MTQRTQFSWYGTDCSRSWLTRPSWTWESESYLCVDFPGDISNINCDRNGTTAFSDISNSYVTVTTLVRFLKTGAIERVWFRGSSMKIAKLCQTRRMYWRRASIQDGQAFTSAWWLPATVFRDNFVIFSRRSKIIAFLESVNFSTCVYMQIFNFLEKWSCDHFSAPFRGLYLPKAWSQTLQTSKRHTFRVSAFYRYPWLWDKTVFCRLCTG